VWLVVLVVLLLQLLLGWRALGRARRARRAGTP
jgi:hypothetical protein